MAEKAVQHTPSTAGPPPAPEPGPAAEGTAPEVQSRNEQTKAKREARNKKKNKGKGGGGSGNGGGGGGGGGGKGLGKFSNYKEDPLRGKIEGQIRNQITGLLSGDIGSFTDEKVAILKQKVLQTARSEERRLLKSAQKDLIRRGVYRSGIAHRSHREITMSTQRTVSQAYNEIALKKVEAEYQDKMTALQMGQKWLDGLRQYELGKEQIAATREATAARTALGYAQIAAGERASKRSAGVARASLGFQKEQFAWQKERQQASDIMGYLGALKGGGVAA